MLFDREITLRRGGRVAATAEVTRELTKTDILAASGLRDAPATQPIAKLRERHHALARALALGVPLVEAAAVTGYTTARIQQLQQDPAFTELITFYRSQVDAKQLDLVDRMASLAADAVLELHERLEENPDSFENDDLVSLVKAVADRSGYGPQTKTTNLNINMNLADRLAEARKRAKIVDAEVVK